MSAIELPVKSLKACWSYDLRLKCWNPKSVSFVVTAAWTAGVICKGAIAISTMLDAVIVGAGPYGLSLAAHFKQKGISFRIFGRPMDSWLRHMPKGMRLKSDGFASTVSDPDNSFTLKDFCAERGIEYADLGSPVALDTFSAFGLAFKDRLLPDLEDKLVTSLERSANGFRLQIDDGEIVEARHVVLAVGITHFSYIPPSLERLPDEFVSHSFAHHDLERFRGRSVAVIGGGSSAIDMAGLLSDVAGEVHLVTRRSKLTFHERQKPGVSRSLWERLRRPQSGLGPGLKSRFCSNWPLAFYLLPKNLRLKVVKTHLGPAGGWFAKDMVVGRVPLVLGCTVENAGVMNGKVQLRLRGAKGEIREIAADHVIAATGYRVDLERLKFLSTEVRNQITTFEGSPDLSSSFESSVPGLYFIGVAAANSFGPLMRFAYGATFAARRLTRRMAKATAKNPMRVPGKNAAAVANYGLEGRNLDS